MILKSVFHWWFKAVVGDGALEVAVTFNLNHMRQHDFWCICPKHCDVCPLYYNLVMPQQTNR